MEDFSWIIWAVLIGIGIIVKIVQSRGENSAEERRRQLILERRRRAAEQAESSVVIEHEYDDEYDDEYDEEPTPRPTPRIRIIEEIPGHSVTLSPIAAPEHWAEKADLRSLEERIFSNRRFSTGAKMVIANEILQRPRALRR